jgi:hypothetical protein
MPAERNGVHSKAFGWISKEQRYCMNSIRQTVLVLTFVFTASLFFSLRPESNVASIEMQIIDCRDSSKGDVQEIEILKDGKKFRTVHPETYQPVMLDSLPLGV